jgi:threonine dehydrogenase-like Zn-dependent dehydrogenase
MRVQPGACETCHPNCGVAPSGADHRPTHSPERITAKAVVYKGPFDVAVEEVPDATIEAPADVIVRIATTNICGSDLHMYEGRTNVEEGKVLGHENMGIVEEVGPGVQQIKVGDRVSVPFNIGCGSCRNCLTGWSSFCTRVNPTEGIDGAAYSYVNMGPYRGGQAEYLRIPFADFNLLELPAGDEHGLGVDRGEEAMGYQAHDPSGQEHPELVLDNLAKSVRTTGGIGVVGVYVPEDPGAVDEGAKEGRIGFDYGTFFTKGLSMGTGQAPAKRYNRQLRDLITPGPATPSFIVSHELPLTDAADGYRHFDKREDGWTMVLLRPGQAA